MAKEVDVEIWKRYLEFLVFYNPMWRGDKNKEQKVIYLNDNCGFLNPNKLRRRYVLTGPGCRKMNNYYDYYNYCKQ